MGNFKDQIIAITRPALLSHFERVEREAVRLGKYDQATSDDQLVRLTTKLDKDLARDQRTLVTMVTYALLTQDCSPEDITSVAQRAQLLDEGGVSYE